MTATADRNVLLDEVKDLERRIFELRRRIVGDVVAEELPPGDVRALLCRVGNGCMAFLQDAVQEVVMMCALTALPEGSPWMAGVLNLRGVAVPVVDVLVRISGNTRRRELTDFIVVCRVRERLIGLVVQEILDVYMAPREAVQAPGADLEHAPYLLGVLYRGDQPVLLLSLPRLLAITDWPLSPADAS